MARLRDVLNSTAPGQENAEVQVQIREAAHEFCSYHKPTDEMQVKFLAVSKAIEDAIVTLVNNCPPCGDRTAAIRMLADARMTANRSISLEGAF